MSPTWTMRLYAPPKRALRPTLRKHRARQPQSNRTKTGRRLESGVRPDLVPLLFAGVGVSGVPKPPVSGLLLALFTEVRGREILGSSLARSCVAPTLVA